MVYGHKLSNLAKMEIGLIGIAVLMIALPFFTNYLEKDLGWAIVLTILVLFGVLSGVVQSTTYGLAGMFPGKYMGAVMLGNSCSGLSLNAIKAVCLGAFPSSEDKPDNDFYGAVVYFVIATVIVVLCALGMFVFQRLQFTQYYTRNESYRRVSIVIDEIMSSKTLSPQESLLGTPTAMEAIQSKQSQQDVSPNVSGGKTKDQYKTVTRSPLMTFLIKMKDSFMISWQFLTRLSMVFIITFVIYPGILCDTNLNFLQSIEDPNSRIAWQYLIYIVDYNVMDTLGRILCGYPQFNFSDKTIMVMTYSRFLFIVSSTLIALNTTWPVLTSDAFKLLNLALFAISNGFCATQCAIRAPSRAMTTEKKE